MSHALEAENLQLWRGERQVLRGVGFSLAGGECLQVRGANGAGKTTLLRAACGLLYPEAGPDPLGWRRRAAQTPPPSMRASYISATSRR